MGLYRPEIEFTVEIDSTNRIHIPSTIRKVYGLKPKQVVKVSIAMVERVSEADMKPNVEYSEAEKKALLNGGLNTLNKE